MSTDALYSELGDYANLRGLPHHSHRDLNRYLNVTKERYISTKFMVFDLNELVPDLYFVFYDSYSTKAYTSITYCGLHRIVTNYPNEVRIMKRDWFDALSFRKRVKTGNPVVDKQITIHTVDDNCDLTRFNNQWVNDFTHLNQKIGPLEVRTIRQLETIIPELQGKDIACIRSYSWIFDHEKLDLFIQEGRLILGKFT